MVRRENETRTKAMTVATVTAIAAALLFAAAPASFMTGAAEKAYATETYTLTVGSGYYDCTEFESPECVNGDSFTGMWTTLKDATTGQVLQSGFTPKNFTLESGVEYKLTAADYDTKHCSHISDPSGQLIAAIATWGCEALVTITEDDTATARYFDGLNPFILRPLSTEYTISEMSNNLWVGCEYEPGTEVDTSVFPQATEVRETLATNVSLTYPGGCVQWGFWEPTYTGFNTLRIADSRGTSFGSDNLTVNIVED